VNQHTRSRTLNTARVLALLSFIVLATRLAWLSDDSLITLRTALNITHGWGPGFNATEAVQGYTHPLWFLIWTGIGSLTNAWVLGILIASITFATTAAAILLWKTQSLSRIIVVTTALVFSNAFMEYSTSGLENPLSYLFVATLFTLALNIPSNATSQNKSTIWAIATGLTVAGVFLTRMDLILLIAPPALFVLWQLRRNLKVILIAGITTLIPVITWFAWTKFAYNTWLPNTATAKANLDIPRGELLLQGFNYFWVSLENDPITFIAIITAITIALATKNQLAQTWSLGIALYLGYVWWIGGDFMAGRFFAVPLLVAVFIIASTRTDPREAKIPVIVLATVGSITAVALATFAGNTPVSLTAPDTQRWEAGSNRNGNIVDERGFYVQNNRDLRFFLNNSQVPMFNPDFVGVKAIDPQIRSLNEINYLVQNWPPNTIGEPLQIPVGVISECGLLGTIGIALGPQNHVIDTCALTDRFLATIPFTPNPNEGWKPGHFERVSPEGYEAAVAQNNPELIVDPNYREQLTQLWSKIRP